MNIKKGNSHISLILLIIVSTSTSLHPSAAGLKKLSAKNDIINARSLLAKQNTLTDQIISLTEQHTKVSNNLDKAANTLNAAKARQASINFQASGGGTLPSHLVTEANSLPSQIIQAQKNLDMHVNQKITIASQLSRNRQALAENTKALQAQQNRTDISPKAKEIIAKAL